MKPRCRKKQVNVSPSQCGNIIKAPLSIIRAVRAMEKTLFAPI
jgi:hypothetical protein